MLDLNTLKNFSIIFIFVVLFGTAAADKLKTLKAPEWFVKQFENTIVAKMPGGAALGYWMVAFFETALTLTFIASIFNIELLPFALVGASFLFGLLCFGLRMVSDFQGSANMFIYFTATMVSLYMVR